MTINYDAFLPFQYQEAVFFIGIELEFSHAVTFPHHKQDKQIDYEQGQRAYVQAVVNHGLGCVLDVWLCSMGKSKRVGYFDKSQFFVCFTPVHLYP